MIKIKRCVIDIESEGLDPKEGRIICIGTMDLETKKCLVFYDEDEKRMLNDFLEYFHNRGFTEVIGYNLLFDIRFIFARCLKYSLHSNGFFRAAYTDLMRIMQSVKNVWSMNKPGTLNEWTEFLFGVGKRPLGESVKEKFEKGQISDIIEYNKRDIKITADLWERVQKVLDYVD